MRNLGFFMVFSLVALGVIGLLWSLWLLNPVGLIFGLAVAAWFSVGFWLILRG